MRQILLIVLSIFFSGCVLFQSTKPTPPVGSSIDPRSQEGVLVPKGKAEFPKVGPPSLQSFLGEVKNKLLAKDWNWFITSTEPAVRDRLLKKFHQDPEIFIWKIFHLGESTFPLDAPDPFLDESFSLRNVKGFEFVSYEKDAFVGIFRGFLQYPEGKKLDFTLYILEELDPPFITLN
jgi:hypothetical protein